jgi:uncharacterized membrane protein
VSKTKGPFESHTRTVVKAISWRVVATCTSMSIVYLLTREPIITLGFGAIEVIAKITFYYLHERAWHKVTWGTKKHPLASLPVNRDVAPEDMEKIKSYLKDLGYID